MANKQQLEKDLYSLESQLGDIQKNAPKYEKLSPSQRFKLKQSINDKIKKKKQQLGENQMTPGEKKLREVIRKIIIGELKQQNPQTTTKKYSELDTDKRNLMEDEEYQKFFDATLKKFGAKSPDELSDEKKKKFFNYIDKNWKAKKETD